MSNIIDKIQVSGVTYDIGGGGGGGNPTVELTQAEYDALVTAGTVAADTFYVITDAQAGDLTQYWTSAQTQSAITQATSGLQETLVSGTNIKTINNESILGSGNIDIQGGSTYTAGRGISIANDTISFNLPISAGTGTNSVVEGKLTKASGETSHAEGYSTQASGNYSHAEGYYTTASGETSHAEGYSTKANGQHSHSEGDGTKANGYYSHAEGSVTTANGNNSHTEGFNTVTKNNAEHASGRYNNSVSASTTFGDSGNTLFSVGNGTADDARHNAFEIRQNGDIYLNNGTSDVKLQEYLQIKAVKLTQSAYDALSPNYDSNTLYIIKD